MVCVLAGCAHAPQERVLSVSQIVKADRDPSAHGRRVLATAVVTYVDPDWRILFVQDETAAIYLRLPAGAVAEPGDKLRISGAVSSPGRGLDDLNISVLSKNNPLPQPSPVGDYSAIPGSLSAFIAVAGTVRWTGIKEGRVAIQLSSGDRPLLAYFRKAQIEALPPIASRVSLAGVAAADVDSFGRLQGTKLLVPSAEYLRVLRPGPSNPFSLPVKTLVELNQVPVGTLVHITGKIHTLPHGLSLSDGTGVVSLNLRGVFDGPSADVAGFWNGQGLEDAMARSLGGIAAHAPAASLPLDGDIVHLSQLKRLREAQASARKRVTVRAVVTYFDPDWRLLFVQDDTAAAFVNIAGQDLRLRPGDLVDISGVSHLGDFAPTIADPKINLVGRAPLPRPFRADLFEDNLPAADAKWCAFRGVVHTVQEHGPHTVLKVGAGPNEVTVQVPTLIRDEDLVDQEISVTGVFGVLFNDRRQAVGHQIFVPSPEFLTIIDPSVRQNTPTSIGSLLRYTLDADERHSVSLNGTVVLKSAGDTVFIQDNSAGIQVRATAPVNIADGDQVSVRGFVIPGDYSPALEDAVITRVAAGALPQPIPTTAKSALEGTNDSRYVSMHGTLTAVHSDRNHTTLVLNDNGTFFEASGPGSEELDTMRIGSEVQVRGVCRVLVDRFPFSIRGFNLVFDSPDSVRVIKLGSWWDARKIAWAMVLIVVLASAASLWAALLRRQVEIQTHALQDSLESKRKARQFEVARNEVLESIARNATLPESMERLATAIEEQIPDSVCAIILPPDGKSFMNGKPVPVLIAPGVPEHMQPALLPLLASVLVPAASADLHPVELTTDNDLMASLLQALRSAGMQLHEGQAAIVFSASGTAAGLLILFIKNPSPPGTEPARQNILQSASRLVALARDHWHMQERLVHEARHDALTGLPNRAVAEDRMEQALARAARRHKSFAVLCIDLDGFKVVNDNLGHHAGDELLQAVATRLRSRVRHSDTVARIGGDEFLAIIEDCSGDAAAQAVAESLVAALQDPILIEGQTLAISGSIGIAMYPADGENPALLKRNADQAMYRAKSQGGSRICFWSSEPARTGKATQTSAS